MDTTWFAVDRDGHVGVFDSGEGGAVPQTTHDTVGQYDDAVKDALASLPEVGEPTIDPAGMVHPGMRPAIVPKISARPRGPYPRLYNALVVGSGIVVPEELRAQPGVRVTRVPNRIPALVYAGEELQVITREGENDADDAPWIVAWTAFHQTAVAKGSVVLMGRWKTEEEIALGRRGVFAFEARSERFNMAEPYARSVVPARPVRVDELPEPLRTQLASRPRLDVSFVDTSYVQPAEWMACATWGDETYLAADGFTIRPLRGSELAFEDSAANIDTMNDEDGEWEPIVFDPPLDADG